MDFNFWMPYILLAVIGFIVIILDLNKSVKKHGKPVISQPAQNKTLIPYKPHIGKTFASTNKMNTGTTDI